MSIEEAYSIVEYIAAFSVFIPIFLAAFRFRTFNNVLWALLAYLFLCVITEGISLAVLPNEGKANIVFNCFTVLEFCFLCYMYFHQYPNRKIRIAISAALFLFLAIAFGVFIVLKGYDKSDNLVRTIESIIMIFVSASFFYTLLLDKGIAKISHHHFYWINLSFLIYFSGVFLLFMNADLLENCKPVTAYMLWGLHQLLNVLTNILIAVGIWKQKREPRYL